MKALASEADFSDTAVLRAYLFRSARNAVVDVFRRRAARRETTLDSPVPAPSNPGGPSDDLVTLESALAKLSPGERSVLSLRYDGGLTYAEIARNLEEPLGTVLARAHRALRKLARLMDGKEAE